MSTVLRSRSGWSPAHSRIRAVIATKCSRYAARSRLAIVRCGATSQDMSPLGRADDRHGIVSRIHTARADALREP